MNILVTGGAGYKGTVLVSKLLNLGHQVTVVDPCWFGNYLPDHSNLNILKSSVLDALELIPKDIQLAIILHSVANDPCSDLDPDLTWNTACYQTDCVLRALTYTSCKKIIFASSASIYGIRDEDIIHEDLEPVAVTTYNKSKAVAERIVLSYPQFNPVILRPATVCGLSPRMRLDTVVNMLSMQALTKSKISIYGGDQYRPNVHIDDLINAYTFFIDNIDFSGVYNVGNDVLTVRQIAEAIQAQIPCELSFVPSNDPRSYRLSTDKLSNLGFIYSKGILQAISEIKLAFESGIVEDKDYFYNIRWMKSHVLTSK